MRLIVKRTKKYIWVKKIKIFLIRQKYVDSDFLLKAVTSALVLKAEQNKVKSFSDWLIFKKGRDYWHITEEKRGAEHVICNLMTRQAFPKFLPMAFHYLKIYDAYFLTELIKQKGRN